MSRKPTNKSDKKKLFFGEHLEIKPAFMQRPKSMEEVMAEAFSQNNQKKDELNTTVEIETTVENLATLDDKLLETTVASNSTLVSTTTVENLASDKEPLETTVASDSTIALTTTIENLTLDKQNLETTIASSSTLASVSTIEPIISTRNNLMLSDEDKTSMLVSATVVNDATVAKKATNVTNIKKDTNATVVNNATVAEQDINLEEIPQRLRADIALLNRLVTSNWQALPEQENISSNYWYAYAQAWHWIEDNVVTHLDKDSKLTLRHCYRKAFGDPQAKGRFFAGQSLLAQEVGLSKRRIQDILEIFNLLGWVRKTAHHNRGGYKGTDYQMYLPNVVIDYFKQ